jgi:hypothetical protein
MSDKREKKFQITILKNNLQTSLFLTVKSKQAKTPILNNKKTYYLSRFCSQNVVLFGNKKSLKYPLEVQTYTTITDLCKSVYDFGSVFIKVHFLEFKLEYVFKSSILNLEEQTLTFSLLKNLKDLQ